MLEIALAFLRKSSTPVANSDQQDPALEPAQPVAADSRTDDESHIPLLKEHATVEKRSVVTGRVRIHTSVEERDEEIRETLRREDVEVERVLIDRIVDAPPPVRVEGDLTIIPVLEEFLVVEKRLRLKEEIHIRRRTIESPIDQTISLRAETVEIERQ
jgi:uncharacterized protein (TIGR02271 family)